MKSRKKQYEDPELGVIAEQLKEKGMSQRAIDNVIDHITRKKIGKDAVEW